MRHGRLDQRSGRGALPGRRALPRPVPRRAAGDQGARRDPPRSLEPRTSGRPDRARRRARRTPASRCWKNPENLTARQEVKLTRIEQANRPLFRAYLLKEQLAADLQAPGRPGRRADLGQTLPSAAIREARQDDHRPEPGILAAINNELSNARVEAINTQIRLITRQRVRPYHNPRSAHRPQQCSHSAEL